MVVVSVVVGLVAVVVALVGVVVLVAGKSVAVTVAHDASGRSTIGDAGVEALAWSRSNAARRLRRHVAGDVGERTTSAEGVEAH